MNFKKTLLLIVILCVLLGIAYMFNRQPSKKPQETTLFPAFTVEDASSILVKGPKNTLTLTKETGGKWVIAEKDNLPADPEQVKQALTTISEIKRENIISQNPQKQEIFQVDPNRGVEVEIKGDGGKTFAHLFLGKTGPDFMSTYIRKDESSEVLLHRGFHLKSRFDKAAETWLDKGITKFQEDAISRIEYIRPDLSSSFAMIRKEGKWLLETPEESAVKEDQAKDISATLASLRAIELQRLQPEQALEELGLDKPQLKIAVTLDDGTSQDIIFGAQKKDKDQYYVKVGEGDILYTIAKFTFDKVNKTWQELKQAEPPAATQGTDPNSIHPPTL